jgi:hypothetical protein
MESYKSPEQYWEEAKMPKFSPQGYEINHADMHEATFPGSQHEVIIDTNPKDKTVKFTVNGKDYFVSEELLNMTGIRINSPEDVGRLVKELVKYEAQYGETPPGVTTTSRIEEAFKTPVPNAKDDAWDSIVEQLG